VTSPDADRVSSGSAMTVMVAGAFLLALALVLALTGALDIAIALLVFGGIVLACGVGMEQVASRQADDRPS
jgi:hypothetical protein